MYPEEFWDEIRRRRMESLRLLRHMMRSIEEMMASMESMMESYMYSAYLQLEELERRRLENMASGVIEPLFSVIDVGDKIVIIIDMPGAVEGGIDIFLGEDSVRVDARIREEIARRAFSGTFFSVRASQYKGEFKLPYRIDPKGASVERRGSRVIITAPKVG